MGKWMLIVMVALLFAGAGVNEARAADSPTITISPASGSCDEPVTISVSGFGDAWLHVMAGPVGIEPATPAYEPLYRELARGGGFAFEPDGASWSSLCAEFGKPAMRIIATATSDVEDGEVAAIAAETTFTKTRDMAPGYVGAPTITLDPPAGTCADPITVHGSGYEPGTMVRIGITPLVTLPGSGGAGSGETTAPIVADNGTFSHVLFESSARTDCNRWSPRILVHAEEVDPSGTSKSGSQSVAVFHRTKQLNGGADISFGAPAPTITVSPASGACDEPVTISVSGFGTKTVSVLAGPMGAEPQVPQYELLYAQLPSNGSFSFTPFVRSEQALCEEFARPAMRIVATLSENVRAGAIVPVAAETEFVKTRETAPTSGPGIVLDPTSGPCDEPITVHGTGFRAGAKIQLGVAPLVTLPGNGGGDSHWRRSRLSTPRAGSCSSWTSPA